MPNSTAVIRRPIYGGGQKVAYTGTAGSVTITQTANSVLVYCSTAAYVRVGATATTADFPVAANIATVLPCDGLGGGPITVSAIQDASGGNLFAMPLAD